MKNKKGTAGSQNWVMDTFGFYIIFIFIVSLAAIFFAYSISGKASTKTKINEEVEHLNLIQRFLESPECFIMDSESILLYNIIDVNKFSEGRLNSCYQLSNGNYLAFKLRLKSTSPAIFYEKEIQTSNWNSNRPFEKRMAPKQVLISSEGKKANGELTIEIQNLQK